MLFAIRQGTPNSFGAKMKMSECQWCLSFHSSIQPVAVDIVVHDEQPLNHRKTLFRGFAQKRRKNVKIQFH